MKCRRCKEYFESGDNYATKSTRHHYHWNCLFEEKDPWEVRIILTNLPLAQLEKIPWKVAETYAIGDQITELVTSWKASRS